MEEQNRKEEETPAAEPERQDAGEPEAKTAMDATAPVDSTLNNAPEPALPVSPVPDVISLPLAQSDPPSQSVEDSPVASDPSEASAAIPLEAAGEAEAATPEPPPQEPRLEIILSFQIDEGMGSRMGDCITSLAEKIETFKLPPSQIGQPYSCVFDLSGMTGLTLANIYAKDFEQIGLAVSKECNGIRIHGNPSREFNGTISFQVNHSIKLESNKDFHVNPDPKSLWKQIEPVDDDGYPKEHQDRMGVEVAPGKFLIAASCRGRSHAHEGKFREDAFHYAVDEQSGWICMALADGAGSAKFSRRGSDLACHESIHLLRETLDKLPLAEIDADILEWSASPQSDELAREKREKTQLDKIFHHSIYHTWRRIKDEADQRQADMRDYYTTLLLAVIKKFDFGWFMASYWVGDGAIAIYCPGGNPEVCLLGKPDSGEFAGQTKFLTMKDEIGEAVIKSRMRYSFLADNNAIVLMSDGISDPFFEAEADLYKIDRWNKLWQDICQVVSLNKSGDPAECADQLLDWLNFWAKGNHDDRTIMIFY